MSSLKKQIKRGIQFAAANFGRHARSAYSPQLLILMYHRILPKDDNRTRLEEPGMLVSPDSFRQHLKILSEYFEFVSLQEWLERKSNGLPLPRKACAITFDDGWADNYEFAFPVLQSMQIPATIFLVSEMIGTNEMFWPERLARLVDEVASKMPQSWSDPALKWLTQAPTDYPFDAGRPSNEQISQLIAISKRNTDEQNHSYIAQAEAALGLSYDSAQAELLNWDQVHEMMKSGFVNIGSHTCHHTRLDTKLDSQQLSHEIITSKNIIEQHIEAPVKTFCFPNGDYSMQALELVKHHYLGAVTTESGWNNSSTDSYLLQRIGVHEDVTADRTGFLARVSGWL